MQKKIIALAIAGLASSAAFAQSNVTIYGVADATFDVAKATGAAFSTNNNRASFTRVTTNSSLLGFKGSEDLGNGMKAVFQFESGANFDSAGALALGRDSYVGLQTNAGEVRLGNLTGPTRLLGATVDMNAGATGPGANSSLIGKVLGGNATIGGTTFTPAAANLSPQTNNGAAGYNSGVFDTRFTNTIAYISPTFSGVSVAVAYVSGENRSLDSVSATAAKVNTKAWDIGVFYNNGPIFVGLSHGKLDQDRNSAFDGVTATVVADETTITRLAGKFTFAGGHQIAALWERNRAEYQDPDNSLLPAPATGVNVRQTTWGLGGKLMAAPALAVIAQYYQTKDASIGNGISGSGTGAKLYELGVEYSLSKRTMLKASYNAIDNKDNANYDFNIGSVGGAFGSGATVSAWQFGVRHTF